MNRNTLRKRKIFSAYFSLSAKDAISVSLVYEILTSIL
jgi:hypothetical protein